jgi:hypothetical protein
MNELNIVFGWTLLKRQNSISLCLVFLHGLRRNHLQSTKGSQRDAGLRIVFVPSREAAKSE